MFTRASLTHRSWGPNPALSAT